VTSDQLEKSNLRVTCHLSLLVKLSMVIGAHQRAGRKQKPPIGDEFRGAGHLTRRGEEGINRRPAARQGGNFGPGSDKPALQSRQLRPPRENDILKVVLSLSTAILPGDKLPR
jgi:hypothetical protein